MLDNADHVTTSNKRLLFIGLDLSGLLLAWAMFGTHYLPYFVIASLAIYLIQFMLSRKRKLR